MAPFSIPAPCIIPLRLPVFGGPKSIDTNTKIQLLCETRLEHEVFYTLDGTKPQPYVGIVQGSKTIKYSSPFYLPPGKITVKAIAINANIHSMCSSIVTKCFEVLKVEPAQKSKRSAKRKKSINSKLLNQHVGNQKNGSCEMHPERNEMVTNAKFVSELTESAENNSTCSEEDVSDSSGNEIYDDDEESSDDKGELGTVTLSNEIAENDDSLKKTEDVNCPTENNVVCNDEKSSPSPEHVDEFSQPKEENAMVQPDATLLTSTLSAEVTQFCCMKCDMTLQQCFTCKQMSAVSSKYCIGCGTKLSQICVGCKEYNPSIATFCQYCGRKLDVTLNGNLDSCLKVDSCVMVKPHLRSASIQHLPVVINKYTQTTKDKGPVKKSPPNFDKKSLPHQSPGRGYWHQQLDYICNHLKSHAYNNLEFRKSISEPVLCDFQSAHITKQESSVTVTIIFTPLLIDKSDLCVSEEIKSKDST